LNGQENEASASNLLFLALFQLSVWALVSDLHQEIKRLAVSCSFHFHRPVFDSMRNQLPNTHTSSNPITLTVTTD